MEEHVDPSKIDKEKLDSIRRKYQRIIYDYGAEIRKIAYITREERYPYLYENTDFSLEGIKNLIKEGESKAKQVLQKLKL